MPKESIVDRLRQHTCCPDINKAADMLEFLLGQFQMHSPKMNGQHTWRFRPGWPMIDAIGRTPEEAIRAAMVEVERSKQETAGKSSGNVNQ